jgi:hypothetical protein
MRFEISVQDEKKNENFQIGLRMPISEAKIKKQYLGIAFGIEINPSKVIGSEYDEHKPTIDNPYEYTSSKLTAIVNPVDILIFDIRDRKPIAHALIIKKDDYYEVQPMQWISYRFVHTDAPSLAPISRSRNTK